VLKKFISKRDIKTLKKISIGERFCFEKIREVSQNFWQVELKEVENLIAKIPSKR
jgi:preprotein translocase subunit Sec63